MIAKRVRVFNANTGGEALAWVLVQTLQAATTHSVIERDSAENWLPGVDLILSKLFREESKDDIDAQAFVNDSGVEDTVVSTAFTVLHKLLIYSTEDAESENSVQRIKGRLLERHQIMQVLTQLTSLQDRMFA